ncbi:MAG: hypothetical protein IJI04_07205 [Lachnospiraceae bacterium]|nr:hypothetical protein [Lachnospiraceae bacterium]
MQTIIGVKFRNTSKIYYFDPKDLDIHYNDHVIVETVRGVEYGTVILSPMQLEDEKVPQPLKDVIRIATELDTEREAENRVKEKEAYKICKAKIAERGLEMKLIQAEYTFDNSKVLFYFTADGRIDFRDLVKELASIFRTRIELRQIGVRDETKILGGMGICGRPLCCHTYLTEFAPVSIKMSKEQNLSLNPTKISGCCGRLMCCLKNEADTYTALSKGLPAKGDQMTTPDGRHGEVHSVDILRQRIKCIVEVGNDEKEMQEFHVSEITFIPHSKKPKGQQNQPKAEKKKRENGGDTDFDAFEDSEDFESNKGRRNRKYDDASTDAAKNRRADEASPDSTKSRKTNDASTDGTKNRRGEEYSADGAKNRRFDEASADTRSNRKDRKYDETSGEMSGENTREKRQRPRKQADGQPFGDDNAQNGQDEMTKSKKRRRRNHSRRRQSGEGEQAQAPQADE